MQTWAKLEALDRVAYGRSQNTEEDMHTTCIKRTIYIKLISVAALISLPPGFS